MFRTVVVASLLSLTGCPGDDGGPTELPEFPADYLSTYQAVTECRYSNDHDLMRIHIYASPEAYDPYVTMQGEFPPGAIILKEEYDGGDESCTGEIQSFAVAKRLEPGTDPEKLDWAWQRVDNTKTKVITEDVKRCYSCHSECGTTNPGYLYTCADKPRG